MAHSFVARAVGTSRQNLPQPGRGMAYCCQVNVCEEPEHIETAKQEIGRIPLVNQIGLTHTELSKHDELGIPQEATVTNTLSINALSLSSFDGDFGENPRSSESLGDKRRRLSKIAADLRWRLDHEELQLSSMLSQTLKSTLLKGRWKGVEVVVKVAGLQSEHEVARMIQHPGSPLSISDDVISKELLHEVDLLSSLRHPDFVTFLGACLSESRPFMLVTEFLPGGDLERYYMAQRQKTNALWRPSLRQRCTWACTVARALTFLHSREVPIVHRDLKPLNLLLTKHLDLKVADLGISRMMPQEHYRMTGGVGSWLYMAPEVVRHQLYNEKVDIYAFALIMYFMDVGRNPFHHLGKDPEMVLKEYQRGREPRPRLQDCHPNMRPIIEPAWHVDAAKRPAAQDILPQLEQLEQLATKGTSSCAVM
ncbi:unnamed protein product [Effrenium voratum]|nr:unnamed protein product [Effrenium voratum]